MAGHRAPLPETLSGYPGGSERDAPGFILKGKQRTPLVRAGRSCGKHYERRLFEANHVARSGSCFRRCHQEPSYPGCAPAERI